MVYIDEMCVSSPPHADELTQVHMSLTRRGTLNIIVGSIKSR